MKRPLIVTKKWIKERDTLIDSFKNKKPIEIFRASEQDITIFAKYMLGVTLYAWQYKVAESIKKNHKYIIMNTSRQIGKSFLVAIIALWFQVFNKGHSSEYQNTKVGIVSATELQAKKLLLDVKNLMRIGDAHCKDVYEVNNMFTAMIDLTQGAENTKTCVTFKAWSKEFGMFLKDAKIGGFIKSLPSTDAIRGETLDLVIVDEAALIDDEIYMSAVSKTGDKFNATRFILSTPRGLSGFFYELFDPESKLSLNEWKSFWFTVDAIKYDDTEDWKRRQKDIQAQLEMGKNLIVRQEYYGEFVKNETSYFDPMKVDNLFDKEEVPVESYAGFCDMGIDFGGLKKSKTVITISTWDEQAKKVKRLYKHVYNVQEDDSLIEDIEDLKTRFNIQRIVVDYCPESDFKVREMERKDWDVTRFEFGKEKVKKFGEFRGMLQKGKIVSFPDSDLAIEMKALATSKGRERTKIQPPYGYSDDLIDSFVISAYHFTTVDDGGFNFFDLDEIEEGDGENE